MKRTLNDKPGLGVAIAFGCALGLLIGCAFSWLIFSTALQARHPPAALAPFVAIVAVYTAIVALRFGRSATPLAIPLCAAILGGLLTLAVGAVLNEMILCHYDRYACINL